MSTPTFFDALSHRPNKDAGNKVNKWLYRWRGERKNGKVKVLMPFSGILRDENGDYYSSNEFEIAYTQQGDKGPVVLFMHGVPTNRYQYFELQKLIAPFSRTVAIDMLGLGESSKPRYYGEEQVKSNLDLGGYEIYPHKPWDWRYDCIYIEQVMQTLYPGEKFVFVADDWSGGINSHYASKYNDRLLAFIQIDPIAFTGYPVNEIQAIGRASQIESDEDFMKAMGDIDSKIIQIEKTMVHNRDKIFNQYTYRKMLEPYVDVDYDRYEYRDGEDATSLTMRLHLDALRVLSDRAAILAPILLQPYDPLKNLKGVQFENITVPSLILFGEYDNMMSANQIYRYFWTMPSSRVSVDLIPRAGHFSGLDNPKDIAEKILMFLNRELGRTALADIFIGYTGIWQGDEEDMLRDLRKIYGYDVISAKEWCMSTHKYK